MSAAAAAATEDETEPPQKKPKTSLSQSAYIRDLRRSFDQCVDLLKSDKPLSKLSRFYGLRIDHVSETEALTPEEFAEWVELRYPLRSKRQSFSRKWNDSKSNTIHMTIYYYDGVIDVRAVDGSYTLGQLVDSIAFIPSAHLYVLEKTSRSVLVDAVSRPESVGDLNLKRPVSAYADQFNHLHLFVGSSKPYERDKATARRWFTFHEEEKHSATGTPTPPTGTLIGIPSGVKFSELYRILSAAIGKPFSCTDIASWNFLLVTSKWLASHTQPFISYVLSNKRTHE